MNYGSYRQCSNGNYEPIEDFAAISCQRCGEELDADMPVFERDGAYMCASCYLDTVLRTEAIGCWYMKEETVAEKIADILGDTYTYADELISEFAPSELRELF